MISPVSTTNDYILQPTLIEKHRQTLDWISSTLLWKRELMFFQKLLDQYASKFNEPDDKKKIDHFQNLIIYYNGEVVDDLRKKLRDHENALAEMLLTKNELKTNYFKEHDGLMSQLETFRNRFHELKEEFFSFIERVIGKPH